MELYVPCTVDLHKHQAVEPRYGLEHINKLLEDELSQLRALKSQKPKEFLLPSVRNRNQKKSEVEGLEDYQNRVGRGRSSKFDPEEKPSKNMTSIIAPFSEVSHNFPQDTRVVGKGEMPFFQLSSDGHSLSCRFPSLTARAGQTSHQVTKDETVYDNQRLNSKRSERRKQSSVKLVRSSLTVKQDWSIDNSDHEDLTNSLRIQYCSMSVRDSFSQERSEKSRKVVPRSTGRHDNKKTFHLACTRYPVKYRTTDRYEEDDTFCTGSVCLHHRSPKNEYGKSCKRDKKTHLEADKKTHLEADKTCLPRLENTIPNNTRVTRESCEKCRKRLEQAEQNRLTLATASSRKFKSDAVERNVKSRPVTKETVDQTVATDKRATVLPLLEYTAYMDQDGSLFLLPGAFTLSKKDYNIWSRKRKSAAANAVRPQTIVIGTSLPDLIR